MALGIKPANGKLVPVTIKFPPDTLELIDLFVPEKYPNRSELIRSIVRNHLLEEIRLEKWKERARDDIFARIQKRKKKLSKAP